MFRFLGYLIATAAAVVAPLDALAARGTPCNSCETCSAALALPASKVVLIDDLVYDGEGPCVTIQGIQASFNGMEHSIRPLKKKGSVGVLVQAPNVLVSNIHVIGAEKGVEVESSRFATLFHLWLQDNEVGISVGPSMHTRIARSVIVENTVGIDIGSGGDGTCSSQDAEKRNRFGTVVVGNWVESNSVGIASCADIPHVKNNVVSANNVGAEFIRPAKITGTEPAKGAYDACACEPTLPGAKPGTTLFYSSGCNGCKVHEEWLPGLAEQGADILLRASGPGTQEEGKVYDGHMNRCAPQVTDALGIPGCVPNYACIANDETFKLREGSTGLLRETEINSADELGAFAKRCATAANERYQEGKDCVRYMATDNEFCGNTQTDVIAKGSITHLTGFANRCGSTQGFRDMDKPGCALTCGERNPRPSKPEARSSDSLLPPSPTALAPNLKGDPSKVGEPVMDMASLLKDKKTKEEPKSSAVADDAKLEGEEQEKSDDTDDEGLGLWFWVAVAGALLIGERKRRSSQKKDG